MGVVCGKGDALGINAGTGKQSQSVAAGHLSAVCEETGGVLAGLAEVVCSYKLSNDIDTVVPLVRLILGADLVEKKTGSGALLDGLRPISPAVCVIDPADKSVFVLVAHGVVGIHRDNGSGEGLLCCVALILDRIVVHALRTAVSLAGAVALVNGVVVCVLIHGAGNDLILGILDIVGVSNAALALKRTVDVGSKAVLVLVEGGHIHGLTVVVAFAAHGPGEVVVEGLACVGKLCACGIVAGADVGVYAAGQMGRPGGHIVDVRTVYKRGSLVILTCGPCAGITVISTLSTGALADLHVLV